ncbi:PAS domain S-box protein [Streptomyces indicus]|uniref:histidine kinase n=1 Tax=Streptomyces indicus TaxID=417292 RepID=A0A1G9FJF5_9ACTN|nr:PAS domain S-box protein [Streptomyces indicus]SDK88509.1 PAS domain S-box-containing protein [Streptomyces indicus]
MGLRKWWVRSSGDRTAPVRRTTRAPRKPSTPVFARLHVGTKLLLLALLPVGVLLTLTVVSVAGQWREADRLRAFDRSTRVSFAAGALADALAQERLASMFDTLRPSAEAGQRLAEARRTTTAALAEADRRAAEEGRFTTRLDTIERDLGDLRKAHDTGAITVDHVAARFGAVVLDVVDLVAVVESREPGESSRGVADAHLSMIQATEAAGAERSELVILFAATPGRGSTTASRWPALEGARLDTFRRTASAPLKSRLSDVLSRPESAFVVEVREQLAQAGPGPYPTPERWAEAASTRMDGLRTVTRAAEDELRASAAEGVRTAEARAWRDLVLFLVLVAVVTAFALALRRSISRPLAEVAHGAKALAAGDLSYDIRHHGRDEIGSVAEVFRQLRGTVERLTAQVREMTDAIDADRLDHRADPAEFQGEWARLLDGLNGTMASFANLHGRRKEAEHEVDNLFTLSADLMCIADLEGYFRRVNPAFEEVIGRSSEELLGRPFMDFVHVEDRDSTRAVLTRLTEGYEVLRFENRYLRADGTSCWLQWNARPVPGKGLIHAAARDVTERRRVQAEQSALRRVATLVAQGVPPQRLFGEVACEVGLLLETPSAAVVRYEADGGVTVLGDAGAGSRTLAGEPAVAEVARSGEPVSRAGAAGTPIVVEGRLWGAVVAAAPEGHELPPGTEKRLAAFTELIVSAIANADSRAQLAASRARVVAASDASRRRIERDLHDGVQQRLVSLQLELRNAEALAPEGSGELLGLLVHIGHGLQDAFDELQRLSRGIHPAILSKGGLGPALRALARRSSVPVELDLRIPRARLPEPVEVAAYYVVSEALANTAKHARATHVSVQVVRAEEAVELAISDDGVGGAEPARGSGLVGLADRVEAIGGTLHVNSQLGNGTSLCVRLPAPRMEKPDADAGPPVSSSDPRTNA